MTESVSEFMEALATRNPGQREFLQAVEEVLTSVWPVVADNPDYVEARILDRIVEPERVIIFRVPWQDDAGDVHVNRGFRVEMNSAIGPYKGGLRFHPTVNLGILKFLAFEQVFKNSLTSLLLGGGKGGADFDPRGCSDDEVMRFCQSFMQELWRHVGDRTDVPAGDIGVGAREIGYLFGAYKRVANEFSGVLTGKGLDWGGSLIRTESTGYGAVYFAEEMLRARDDSVFGKTCLISGSGNVAQHAIENINRLGGKAVTLSDSSGFVHDPGGIDAEKLAWVKELKNVRRGRIADYGEHFGVEYHIGRRPWGVAGAELAFPCATQNELDESEADQMIANEVALVAEGANMPCTLEAVGLFHDAKALFGPAKAANAGGVAVSGLEQSQNALRMSWSREEVDKRLDTIMEEIHAKCVGYGKTDSGWVDYVRGANLAGFVKVADAMLAYGIN